MGGTSLRNHLIIAIQHDLIRRERKTQRNQKMKDALIGTAIVWLPIMLAVISGGLMQALGL